MEPYGGVETRRELAARNRTATRERSSSPHYEAHREPWRQLRNRSGMIPYFHLISSVNGYHASLTMCGEWGTALSNDGVTEMIRCPVCDVAQDILRP